MNFRIPRALSTLGISGLVALAAGCTGSPKGQLMVAVQTDMSVPDDINTLRIEVFDGNGALRARVDNEIRPFAGRNGIYMPGTLGVVEGSTQGERVEIRVASKYKYESSDYEYDPQIDDPQPEGVFRTLREVVTTLPVGRVAVLPLPIQWLCSEDPDVPAGDRQYLSQDGDEVDSECPPDQTCVAGTCVDNEVAEDDLSEFDEDDPLSTGMLGDGTCFDTTGCFEAAQLVVPDFNGDDECTLQVDDVEDLNVALFTGRREAGTAAAPAETGDEDAGVSAGDAPEPPVGAASGGAASGGAASGGAASGGAASGGDPADDGQPRTAPSGGAPAGSAGGTAAPSGGAPGTAGGAAVAGEALPAPTFKGTDGAPTGRVAPTGVGGVCFDDGLCLVPLDKDDETGWSEGSGSSEIRLPVAVCRRIEEGRIQGVAISTSCQSKTASAPICGAWLEDGDEGTSSNAPDAIITLTRPQGFVDDLEDGTEEFALRSGETGTWTASVEGSTETPEIVDDEDGAQGKVIRFSGTLGDEGNDGTTGVGFLFDEDYDASDYGGIRFFARAEEDGERVLITARPRETISVELGGDCESNCPPPVGYLITLSTSWAEYRVSFDSLFSASETGSADQIGGVAFFPQDPGDFEFFVDDIQFLTGDVVSTPPDDEPVEMCTDTQLFGQLLVDLEETRACDPDAQDPCETQVLLDEELGLFLYVTDEAQASAAQDLYADYETDLAMCPNGNAAAPAGGVPGGELLGPHCIPTGDGAGVCSAVGSPFFTDPEGDAPDPVDCEIEPRQVGDDFDDFEDADVTTAFGSDWTFIDEVGMLIDISPTEEAAYEGTYGLAVPGGVSALVLFADSCPIDTSSYIGVSFYARSEGPEEVLVFAFGTATAPTEDCAMGTGACPTPSESPFSDLTSEWAYHEVFFSDLGLSGSDGIVDAVIQSSSGFQIDDIRFLTSSAQPVSTCGDYVLDDNEVCDDGNINSGDGCSIDCLDYEPGFVCTGSPGSTTSCVPCGGEGDGCCIQLANDTAGSTVGASGTLAECQSTLVCDPELQQCLPQGQQPFGRCTVADGIQGECLSGEVCYGTYCTACSTAGAACCEGNTCDANHTCVDDAEGAPAQGPSIDNICVPCGGLDQACCGGTTCDEGQGLYCFNGLYCTLG